MKFIVFYLIIFSCSVFAHDHHEDKMKAFTPPSGSSILQLNSKWKNQNGDVVSISELQGKARLIVMLFTRCETACPLIVEDLKDIAKELNPSHSAIQVEVTLFSLDSFRETPESLKAFAVKRKLPSNWQLLTSDANAVAELAAALGVRYKRLQSGDFIHSNVIYFLDKKGEITAQKEGIKSPRGDFIKKVKKTL